MDQIDKVTTGINELYIVIDYLRLGDNVVLQVSNVEDHINLAKPFAKENFKKGKRLVYLRFANHPAIFTAR